MPDTLCVAQDSVLISSHRNPGCTQLVNWTISAPDQNAYRVVNDTTIKVKFSTYGNYTVAATLASCSNVTDTAKIFIAKNASLLSLGPDKTLCSFSTAVLNAGGGFKTYSWYNGSTDSVNTVYDAGKYFVTVTDYCNNTASDTINFTLVNAPVFDLTPAQAMICNNDTLSLTAPAGFSNYTWASSYNISSTTGQSIKVWPAQDTVYTVTAVFNNSCTVLDSIKILVRPAVKINLGNDTSFCAGQSVYLDAGAGFNNYTWSNGAGTQGITVSAVGVYSVEAGNNSGCISKDTLKVLAVYPNPIVDLGSDTSICKNTVLVLDAGNAPATYLWQDNSHSQFFSAKNVGAYSVIVTTDHGCKGTGGMSILQLLDTPAHFILPVYELCSNTKSFIKAVGAYSSYLWSAGGTKDSVFINQPGKYWLQVSNTAGCKAKEDFIVKTKKCIEGIYFPNTFTPNNDMYNNSFKALVFEDLAYFQLVVYDRYGRKMFETRDYTIGWDGTFKGAKQQAGAYVWTCSYQLKSGASQVEKGTILLLR
jgi:gliding motility-associated-like protein